MSQKDHKKTNMKVWDMMTYCLNFSTESFLITRKLSKKVLFGDDWT